MFRHVVIVCTLMVGLLAGGVRGEDKTNLNRPERVAWFEDLALGMFIHWSVDSQLGSVISHSLVGSTRDYQRRFFEELPETFDPDEYDPDDWARLAELCGFKYAVFTTKHHSGFCMYDTKTTDFSIMHTPYGKDATRQFVDAFRRRDIGIGFYFSPDDFWKLAQQDLPISRRRPEALPTNNQALMQHNLAQLRELMGGYGPVDVLFLDGEPNQLKQLAWKMQPKTLVTRGAMETPEQTLPDKPIPGPWEACFTLGTQWQFKPTNENYKSGGKLIEMLIETRAKGGNLLLNIGPEPSGVIPHEQVRRIRELGLWLFINGEAIYRIRPWHVTREGDLWFTRAKDDPSTVYVFLTRQANWKRGQRRQFTLQSVRATDQTDISVLGHAGQVLEYNPKADPAPRFEQKPDALHLDIMRAQRIYNDHQWPNPLVVKLTHVQPVK